MADNHLGYSMPIGGVAAYREMISPSGVGYDIGCGVWPSAPTSPRQTRGRPGPAGGRDRRPDQLRHRPQEPDPVDHALFDSPVWDEVPELTSGAAKRGRGRCDAGRAQLGTVGSGNHYVDLLVEPDDGWLWVACHFGSRGFGHGVATGFLNLAAHRVLLADAGRRVDARRAGAAAAEPGPRGELGARPQDAAARAEIGRRYELAMDAGRRVRLRRPRARDRAGAGDPRRDREPRRVHNHHNYAWTEEHDGEHRAGRAQGRDAGLPRAARLHRRLDGRLGGGRRGRRVRAAARGRCARPSTAPAA